MDPTQNVLDLVQANNQRLDELRAADHKLSSGLRKADYRRVDERFKAHKQYTSAMIKITTAHQKELSLAESKRIDAIRAVDVAAVQTASERAAAQANVLANQVAGSAETLRGLVATTASAVATQLNNTATQLTDRIALLERSQYEAKGRSGVSDPMMADFMAEMKKLVNAQSEASGAKVQSTETRGSSQWLTALIITAAFSMLMFILSAASLIYLITRK